MQKKSSGEKKRVLLYQVAGAADNKQTSAKYMPDSMKDLFLAPELNAWCDFLCHVKIKFNFFMNQKKKSFFSFVFKH